MKSLYFQSFFYVLSIFIFLSLKAIGEECRDLSSYLIAKENPYFQVVKVTINMKKSAYRSRELMVALSKNDVEKSWFRVLTLTKKPLVDTPACTL